ncbi:uncharacterized protein LOC120840863 [Ixodes scapularis]|uniref:uncharacterized protein LOC120840863 n=1 Tax=Ixodes scapularis TaxID=6945 RepID=UPI001A9E3526|nr:uncharacterized protein LOC120840863 [Ixodes scapularis]
MTKKSCVMLMILLINLTTLNGKMNLGVDISSLESDCTRRALYESQGIYLKPQELTLPSGDKVYYIPLMNILEHLLKHRLFEEYFQTNLLPSSDGVLRDFKDGLRFQRHPIIQKSGSNAITILLYCDDIEVANPLGMKHGFRGKLTMFYVTFVNIPASERSKLKNIFLLAVGHAKALKSCEAKSAPLHDFIATVNTLARGCEIETRTGRKLFYGCLLAFIGDSLACHNMGGFKESFSPNVRLACRTCNVPTASLFKYHYNAQCPPRTEEELSRQLKQLSDAKNKKERRQLSTEFGLSSRSVLSEVSHFSLISDLLYDPMHVLLEGVVPKEIFLFVHFMVREAKWLTLDELNVSVTEFSFHRSISKSDNPRVFASDLSIATSASGSLVLLLHLPVIVERFLPSAEEPHVKCFLMLCILTQMVLSPIITVDTLTLLESLIAQYNQLFVDCYGSTAFIPKLHMIVHIIEQIKRFGPSRHHWAIRFEGKNALPKAKKFRNFKNLPLSVSEYLQLNTSFELWDANGCPKETSPPIAASGKPFVLTTDFLTAGLDDSDLGKTALEVQATVIDSVPLKVSDVMMIGKPSERPAFVKVLSIILWKSQIFFACRVQVAASFVAKLNMFMLHETSHWVIITTDSLLYPWPVWTYTVNKQYCCIPKCLHRLPEFSQTVQPLLRGSPMSAKEHKKMCRQLGDELLFFLDENKLVTTRSKSQERWEYKSLGDALATKFPSLSWENPDPGAKVYQRRSQIYAGLL